MSPRTGRPKSDNSKHHEIKVRATKEDREKLLYCCEKTGMTQYEVVMKGIEMQQKIQKIIIVKKMEDKKYRINGFFTLKKYEEKIERAIEEFNCNSNYVAIMYDISLGQLENEMARMLHESMDLIDFECSNDCALPDIKDYIV